MLEQKNPILSLAITALTIIGAVATVFSCLIAFIVLVNPTAAQKVIIEFYNPTTPTPQVIVVTQPAPILPTYTPYPTNTPARTNTLIPTATATVFVAPADGILFQDDFDNNIRPEWTQYSGTWLIVDGRLTTLRDEQSNQYVWIGLDKPEWKNYTISINVNIPQTNNSDPVVIALRTNTNKKPIGIYFDFWPWVYWSFIGDEAGSTSPIADRNQSYTFPESTPTTIEMTVQGDTYTLTIAGKQIQQLTLDGYTNGGIKIGTHCYNYKGCPSFDNLKVTYLP